ncbi:MAG TPA: hypothetical protein VM866_05845 [Pyrinomonadaceae bacterium]|jgi:hypothetical protein|nr:hypothetical protein [Pyrinomonadaceae bacterium]
MSGLYHDFFLVSRKEHDFSDYMFFINSPNSLKIPDDLIRYMLDTMNWLSTYNPAKSEDHKGLCLYGPTVIRTEGAGTAAKVFRSYADLFSNDPKKLRLTGPWSAEEGKPRAEGGYQQIEFERDMVVGELRQLAADLDRVAESDDEMYVLHLGI